MRRVAAVLIAMLIAAPAWGGFDEGLSAWARGDFATAAREFRPLAERGHVRSQSMLGRLYKLGFGVPQNFAEAAKWLRLASEGGSALAMVEFGELLTNGEGLPQDFVQAHKWFNLAALLSLNLYELAAPKRELIAKRMTPTQIAEARRFAREWLAKHGK